MKYKKCTGRKVYLLMVDNIPNSIFYSKKELNELLNTMGYTNTWILETRIILNGKLVAENRIHTHTSVR